MYNINTCIYVHSVCQNEFEHERVVTKNEYY